MKNTLRESLDLVILSFLGVFSATGLAVTSTEVLAQQNIFPDVSPQYWASPFIKVLAQEGILKGYPDGTFRPEKMIDRDEFAAVVRQAFERKKVKNIPAGSSFNDVPVKYWAANPIEEAYESGFMKVFPNNNFYPQKELSKVEALIALTRGLNLSYQPSKNNNIVSSRTSTLPRTKINKAKSSLIFPLASTSLMQPFYRQVVSLTTSKDGDAASGKSANTAANSQNAPTVLSAKELLNAYYKDTNKIPSNAINDVAAATQSDIVVNYPNKKFLNPQESLTRGETAALIHQALVARGKLKPVNSQASAFEYIIKYPLDN